MSKPFSEIVNSYDFYKDLFDQAHDLIHILTPDGTILYVNNSWMRVLGYTMDEVAGRQIYDYVMPKQRKEFQAYRKSITSETKDGKSIVVSFESKSGKEIVLEGFVGARYEAGIPQYTRGIFRDITARVEQEKRLKEREDNLQQLISHAPDAVIVINESSLITLWNPKAEELFGWKAKEVLGHPLQQYIIPPAYREAHAQGMKRYIHTGQAHVLNKTIELSALNKQGKEFFISLTISTTTINGRMAFISFIRDITKERNNILELERQRKELEHFSWLTSHDLKEPLRKIVTYSDMLLTLHMPDLTDTVERSIRKIHSAGLRMSALIQSILSYTRLETHTQVFERVDLHLILQDVLNDLELMIKEEGAEITAAPLPVIEAIPTQMQQLFFNLLSNAIKYRNRDRKPLISIHSKEEGNTIQLTFTDNGIGFSEKDQQKIFGLFQRLHTGKNVEGSGVGLAICKKIVEFHGGTIHAQSQQGSGTTFTVTLPLQQHTSS